MAFLKKYSYIAFKLFLNQFAISLFGFALAFACGRAENMSLMLVTSIFSVIFYLFLQYAVMWEVGAKDGISATAHRTSRGLWRGFAIAGIANAANILLAILVFTKTFTGVTKLSAVAQFIAMVLQGMYQGILSQTVGGVQLHELGWMYFAMILPAMLVCGGAYIIGSYNLHFTNILIPKNKDVKNNGRPE